MLKEKKEIFEHFGITVKELKVIYRDTVIEVRNIWKEGCIEEYTGRSLPKLVAQIGYHPSQGLMSRVFWQYPNEVSSIKEWSFALKIEVLKDINNIPIVAGEWLYEDGFFKRTGKIPNSLQEKVIKEKPLCFYSYSEIENILAEGLRNNLELSDKF